MKEIAAGETYAALQAAVEQGDYEGMFDSYMAIWEQIGRGRSGIEEGIENLSVQNKDEHRDKFSQAFDGAVERMLPAWYEVEQRLQAGYAKWKVMEGEVFGFGKKGDPLVRTPEGVIVVLKGSGLQAGDRTRFRVLQEAEKMSFGRVFELTRQSFYTVMTQETHDKIQALVDEVDARVGGVSGPVDEVPPSELAELLQRLEEIRKLAASLRAREKDAALAKVVRYRQRLLSGVGKSIVFDLISKREEVEIGSFYPDGGEEKASAMSALGLFRPRGYDEVGKKLLPDSEPEKYQEMLENMKEQVDSMDRAMEFLEFKSAMDDVYPKAKRYLERMDRFFNNLALRADRVTSALSRHDVVDVVELRSAIESAFSEQVVFAELRRAFRSSKELLSLRAALADVNRSLGDEESVVAETAFRPYLRHKVAEAFAAETSSKR